MAMCSYQVYKISVLYFSYTTTTSVSYQKVSTISMPGISICFNKESLLREEYRRILSEDNNGSQLNASELLEQINLWPINKQHSALYSMSDIFNNSCRASKPIAFANSTDQHIPCHVIAPIRQSINYFKCCFTFLSQLDDEPTDRYLIYDDLAFKDYLTDLFHIDVSATFNSMDLIIHSRDERMANTYKKRIMKFEYRPNTVFYAEYLVTRVSSLPPPYATRCYDYKASGHKSRQNCIQRCRVDHMSAELGGGCPATISPRI
ncbi:unnamed protein product [Medioppia subpectinata]|uniref:Uncharacterized protein n=1 Tax=Medioppia subpectinata TaxID=1979941 RepID=A0A7R9PU39_9ACAR|nr:unnamed protein product [Medioppia subpectinata]CAG2101116.1 unnamed protein product [Medioppia subpectinata]